MDDIEDQLQSIAESALFSGAFEEADKLQRQQLLKDTEWNTPKCHHLHTLVDAFAVGILTADPWHLNYKIPPNFENVMNWISFCVRDEFKNDPDVQKWQVAKVSLIEMEEKYNKWAYENPNFIKWNESENDELVNVTSRYFKDPEERDFIDLGAAIRNAVVYLRNEIRKSEAFDKEHENDWKEQENKRKLSVDLKTEEAEQKLTQFALTTSDKKREWMDFYYQNSSIINKSINIAKQNNLSEEAKLQLCIYALMEEIQDRAMNLPMSIISSNKTKT